MSRQQLEWAQPDHSALLQLAERVPGAAASVPVDFLVPGLDGLHFVAYGTSQGSVVICCARQVREASGTCRKRARMS